MPTERQQPATAVRPRSPRPRRRWLLVALSAVAAAALSLVVLVYRQPEVIYAFDVHEALARHERGEPLDYLRIHGVLVPSSLVRSDQRREVSFQMRSLREPDRTLSVRATAEVTIPDADAQRPVELAVQGRWREDAADFEADWVRVRYRYDTTEGTYVPVMVPP